MVFIENKKNRGSFLIEIIISISIISIVGFISVQAFKNLSDRNSLDSAVNNAISILAEARSKAISSKNSSDYGVHFEATKIVRSTGNQYSANDTANINYNIGKYIEIVSPNPSDVVFKRLFGNTENFGTTTFRLKSDHSQIKNINIYSTGVVEIIE